MPCGLEGNQLTIGLAFALAMCHRLFFCLQSQGQDREMITPFTPFYGVWQTISYIFSLCELVGTW